MDAIKYKMEGEVIALLDEHPDYDATYYNPEITPNPHKKVLTLNWAIENNFHAVVEKLLLPGHKVNPAARDNNAIILASIKGHTKIVKLMLADHRVNPAAHNNRAIKIASENGHTEVVNLLLNDPRVREECNNIGNPSFCTPKVGPSTWTTTDAGHNPISAQQMHLNAIGQNHSSWRPWQH
jgi:ankyrin repeat protein